MINYCDKCADDYGYPKRELKIKAHCQLCGFVGPVSRVRNIEIVSYEGFNETMWNGGGFEVRQLEPFPLGQRKESIHSKLAYKLLTEKCTIYYDKNLVIVANPKTGQQIQITF